MSLFVAILDRGMPDSDRSKLRSCFRSAPGEIPRPLVLPSGRRVCFQSARGQVEAVVEGKVVAYGYQSEPLRGVVK